MAGLIEDYALIGDMQTAALVGPNGSVDWLCLPRFDSDACFAALLGDEHNGQWRVCPTTVEGPVSRRGEVTRQYRGDSLILETRWQTMSGVVRVLDFMPPRDDIAPVMIRIVEGVEGAVEMESVFRLRFGYGKVVPWVQQHNNVIRAIAGPDSVCLRTPVKMTGRDMAHEATFTVRAGDRVPFVLSWHASHEPLCDPVEPEDALTLTEKLLVGLVGGLYLQGRLPGRGHALADHPQGADLRADRRHRRRRRPRRCPRTSAGSATGTTATAGCATPPSPSRPCCGPATPTEAEAVAAVAAAGPSPGDPSDVQIMYGVAGERRLAEWEVAWLPGYERSAPVRIGNAAVDQRQLDVYGEVMDALTLGRQAGLRSTSVTWSLQLAAAGVPRAALARAGRGHLGGPRPAAALHPLQGDGLGRLRPGHSPGRSTAEAGPVEAVDGDPGRDPRRGLRPGLGRQARHVHPVLRLGQLDASVLLIPQVGFLPPDDDRVVVDGRRRSSAS